MSKLKKEDNMRKTKIKQTKVKASKTEKAKVKVPREKKPKTKNAKGNEKKKEIPFYRSIAMRLILAFLLPVIGVLALGLVSYRTASNAIVNTYKNSVQQTIDTMQRYVDLIVGSEKDEFKIYLTEGILKKYFGGLMDSVEENGTRNDYQSELRNKLALDSKIQSAYFLADNRRTINAKVGVITEDLYTAYKGTEQGAKVTQSSTEWFYFGQDDESDEAIGIGDSEYCVRIAKKMNDQPAIMIVNISADFVRSTMLSLDPGKGGYVAMVTTDGKEFYADEATRPKSNLIYGTDFYQKAMESKEQTGNQMIQLNGEEYMFVYSKLSTGNIMMTALIPSARLIEKSAEIKQLTMILTIICILIALVLGTLISRQMTGTIQYILRQLRKVSKGDLTVSLKGKHRDEFGLLCDGVNDTVDHMKALIRDVNAVSEQVGVAAVHLAETSGTFMETSQNIQDAVIEIESGVNKLDTGSDNCLNQMDSLSGKITNVSSNADELEKLTNEAGETISAGISSVQTLTKSSEETVTITRNVIESIQELEEQSRSISNIVSAINDIAEQTNLLSLNASIEAARAGEAGRGFSVVAEEIRKLADQCLASAGQISHIVDDIVTRTGNVVSIARKAEEAVASQSSVVETTTDSFRQIDQLVAQLIQALQIISNNVQEMNGARNETLSAIESISDASSQTAECSTSVHTAAGTQMEAVKNLDEASRSLTEKAEKLLDALATFQI
ncbi:MAG: methyl-accepting chemotaxis protein [Lachnospiraceae bacterium]|nr:methyl-accepting chemotaxis protein [Lachnospiraceae bacterium]